MAYLFPKPAKKLKVAQVRNSVLRGSSCQPTAVITGSRSSKQVGQIIRRRQRVRPRHASIPSFMRREWHGTMPSRKGMILVSWFFRRTEVALWARIIVLVHATKVTAESIPQRPRRCAAGQWLRSSMHPGRTSQGMVADLGVVRADQSDEPVVTLSVIAHPQMDSSGRCLNFFNGSMAYDETRNKLFVGYTDGCNGSDRLILTTSADEGKTWTPETAIQIPRDIGRIESPSLVVVSDQLLGLLWKDKPISPRWFFSYIRDGSVLATPVCLTDSPTKPAISNDSLWTEIIQSNRVGGSVDFPSESSITLNVRTLLNAIWRSKGVLMTGGKVSAIWSSGTDDGMRLYYEIVSSETLAALDQRTKVSIGEEDVSRDVQLVYGGDRDQVGQDFDEATGTLKICTAIRNLGHHPIEPPIKFRVEDLNSTWGSISVLNSSNHLPGTGAIFDVSSAFTGSQIPPGRTLESVLYELQVENEPATLPPIPVDLLSVKLRIFARYPDRDRSLCDHSN